MSRGIFLVHASTQLVEMHEEEYDTEDRLQRMLEKYPNLLAGDQMDPTSPRRWLLVAREGSVPSEQGGSGRWSMDHLFLDQDAIPTIVEVKRSTDSRIRREVVGQILDYAANAVLYWPVDHLRTAFEANCSTRGVDPNNELSTLLGVDQDVELFWQRAKTNLQAGKIRLVFVADLIPAELRRVVEFLNSQMDPAEVLAVEIRQYTAEGFQTLVPTVMGQTAEAQQRKSSGPREERQWDEATFFDSLQDRAGAGPVRAAHAILDWACQHSTRVWWGKGKGTGSFGAVLRHKEVDHQLLATWTYGKAEVLFQNYLSKEPFSDIAVRRELLSRLNAIKGVAIAESALEKRPSIPLSVLDEGNNMRVFLDAFSWVVATIAAS